MYLTSAHHRPHFVSPLAPPLPRLSPFLPPSLLLSTSSFLHHFRYSALICGPHELVLPALGRRIARCGFSHAIDLVPIFLFLYALRLRQFLV
jgi:hypothetical protein